MNREIKFRGKMIPENEWIFGTILRIPAPPVCFGKSETVSIEKAEEIEVF